MPGRHPTRRRETELRRATTIQRRGRQPRDQPDPVDRRAVVPADLLRGDHHLRRAPCWKPGAAARGRPASEAQSKALSVLVNAQAAISSATAKCCAPTSNPSRIRCAVAGDDRARAVLLRADAHAHQSVVTALDASASSVSAGWRSPPHRGTGASPAELPRSERGPRPPPPTKRLRRYAKPIGAAGIGRWRWRWKPRPAAALKLLGPIVDDIFVEAFQLLAAVGLVLLLLARGLFGLVADYTIARSRPGSPATCACS